LAGQLLGIGPRDRFGSVAQRVERALEMVVAGMHADAQQWRDLGPAPSLEEGFEDDLTCRA
jgi:hypothetical protein